jgi:hypothetical protein
MKIAAAAMMLVAGAAQAQMGGLISTDRFGYTGTVVRYASLSDAQAGINATDTVSIGDRDLSIYVAQNDTVESDVNYFTGSWWYTTDPSGTAGWGNNRGNTGVGILQMYDEFSTTDTSVSMNFGNFDGTHYTEFSMNIQGANAGATEYSRLSVYDNLNDGGIWHDYNLSLTATGLTGTEIAPGIIESNTHPTGVSGSITGIFEITENQTTPAHQGFYVFDFDLNMVNWAYENRNDLTGDYSFDDSLFRTVPTPATGALIALAGVGAARRRRR